VLHLKNENEAIAEIYLYGATVTRFKNVRDEEVIFLSPKAILDGSKPIRGGIPICWPQFGPGKLQQHGFARISVWQLFEQRITASEVCVNLQLIDNEETLKIWNHHFKLNYIVTLNDYSLTCELHVTNTGNEAFSFTGALHTYFASKIEEVKIHGLKGLTYIDKTKNNAVEKETDDVLVFSKETDRAYLDSPSQIRFENFDGFYTLDKTNFKDVVIWNPYQEKAKQMADLGEENWNKFVCVESAVVKHEIVVNPNSTYNLSQKITLTPKIKL